MSEEEQQQEPATEQPTDRPEQEYHPADPHFNPAHPDNAAWRSGPPSPDMPAEAGIVAMFQDPKGPIGASNVHVEPPPPGPEFQKDLETTPEPGVETVPPATEASSTTGSEDDTTATPAKKPARRR